MIELLIGTLAISLAFGWFWLVGHVLFYLTDENLKNSDKLWAGFILTFLAGFVMAICWGSGHLIMGVVS